MVLPEKLSCLSVDRRGDFCAGGTAQGRLYLWEVSCFHIPSQNHNILSADSIGDIIQIMGRTLSPSQCFAFHRRWRRPCVRQRRFQYQRLAFSPVSDHLALICNFLSLFSACLMTRPKMSCQPLIVHFRITRSP
jgi:hypothetical protein